MIGKYREVAHSFSRLWFLQDTLTWSASHLRYKWLCSKFVSWKHFNSFCTMHDFYVEYISTNLSMILLTVPNLLSFCLIWQAAFTPGDLCTCEWSLDLQGGQVLGTGFSVFLTFHVGELEDKPWRDYLTRFSFCLATVTILLTTMTKSALPCEPAIVYRGRAQNLWVLSYQQRRDWTLHQKEYKGKRTKKKGQQCPRGCEQVGWNLWELPASSKPQNYSKLCIYKVWLG